MIGLDKDGYLNAETFIIWGRLVANHERKLETHARIRAAQADYGESKTARARRKSLACEAKVEARHARRQQAT